MNRELFKYFPEGREPRDNQIKIIQQLIDALDTDKKFIVINAPTGTGKSYLAATLANASNEPSRDWVEFVSSYKLWNPVNGPQEAERFENSGAAVLTVTKNLQDQYTNDFDNLFLLKGKANYICEYDQESDVEIAPCTHQKSLKKECWDCGRCTYYEDRNKSLINKFGVYNYDVWLNLPSYARKKEVLICDEASELENVIISHFSLSVNYEYLEKTLNVKQYPRLKDESVKAGYSWLMDLNERALELREELNDILQNTKHPKFNKSLIQKRFVDRLIQDCDKVIANWGFNGENDNAVEYVIEKIEPDPYNKNTKEGVLFTPYRANKLAHRLFETADRVILMSATIIDHMKEMEDLGIRRDQYVYIEAPASFDPKKSPIHIVGNYPLTYKTMDSNLPKVIELTDKIIKKHKNDKGLVHTVNFKITKSVEEKINDDRLIFRDDGRNNIALLKEHTETDAPTVMVSPSMSHGVDLKGDLGRFQIIMKIPYLPLSSKRIKLLSKEDYRWYVNKTLSTLVQMAGRCTRNDDDHSVTYIVDGSATSLIQRNWNKLPKYFRDRF